MNEHLSGYAARAGLLAGLAALAAALACTRGVETATPTAQAVATRTVGVASPAVATVVAAASPAATAIGAASPAVETAITAASPAAATGARVANVVATAVAGRSAGGIGVSPTPLASVVIAGVQPSASDLAMSIQNRGVERVDLSGWGLRVGSASTTLPPDTRVEPGERLVVHTAAGASIGHDLYLGGDGSDLLAAVQPGVTISLFDRQNSLVSEFTIPR